MADANPPNAALGVRNESALPRPVRPVADTTKRYSIKLADQNVVNRFAVEIGRDMLLSPSDQWRAFLQTKCYDPESLKIVKGLRRRTCNTESKQLKTQLIRRLLAAAASGNDTVNDDVDLMFEEEDDDEDLVNVMDDCPPPAPL
jgi:hypothetical protein